MAYMRSSLKRYGRPMQGFGDGPITSPSQVDQPGEIQMPDDYVGSGSQFNPTQDTTVATVGPTIVPPDTSLLDEFKQWWSNLTTPSTAPVTTTAATAPSTITTTTTAAGTGTDLSTLLLIGA